MRIAVIGGTGLIGSAIVAYLSSQGHAVVAMSRSARNAGTSGISIDISTGCPILRASRQL